MRVRWSAKRWACTRHVARRSSPSGKLPTPDGFWPANVARLGRDRLQCKARQDARFSSLKPRRQVVRHLTLTQAFGGSNPSGAANPADRFSVIGPNKKPAFGGLFVFARCRFWDECQNLCLRVGRIVHGSPIGGIPPKSDPGGRP